MSSKMDLSGERYNHLTVVEFSHEKVVKGGTTQFWLCKCDCGNDVVRSQSALRSKNISSCGCHGNSGMFKKTHGMVGTKAYNSWAGLLSRTTCETNKDYHRYGAVGITVCDRWNPAEGGSFEDFFEDMGHPPTPKHSLDRKDGTKGYSPENCRWATDTEQILNRRQTVMVEWEGEVVPQAQLAREFGLSPKLVNARVKIGWTLEEALTTPKGTSWARHRKASE